MPDSTLASGERALKLPSASGEAGPPLGLGRRSSENADAAGLGTNREQRVTAHERRCARGFAARFAGHTHGHAALIHTLRAGPAAHDCAGVGGYGHADRDSASVDALRADLT